MKNKVDHIIKLFVEVFTTKYRQTSVNIQINLFLGFFPATWLRNAFSLMFDKLIPHFYLKFTLSIFF